MGILTEFILIKLLKKGIKLYILMSLSADRRRETAERISRCSLNHSGAKALYSFSKAQRFPQRMYRSVTNMNFYNVEPKKYNKRVSFTTTKRSDLSKDNGVPGPTKYSYGNFSDKRLSVQFKAGRQQCKAYSVFQPNCNPGPGNYESKQNMKYKSIYFSLAKRIQIKQPQGKQSPGPIYNIESTLLDQNKHLSIYVKRNSTRICKPKTCFPLSKRQKTEPVQMKSKQQSQANVFTYKGGRALGRQGPFPTQTHEKRTFQREIKQDVPGPGHYRSFSQFVTDNIDTI